MKNLLLFSIFLALALPIYCMEAPRDTDTHNDINQSNIQADDEALLHKLANHSVELLEEILNLLPIDDQSYNTVKQNIKLPMTETKALRIAEYFYKKILAKSKNLDQLLYKINKKYNSLEKSFPHYNVLKDAFEKILIFRKKSMKRDIKPLTLQLKAAIRNQDWNEFDLLLNQYEEDKKQIIEKSNNGNTKLLELKQLFLTILKIKHKLTTDFGLNIYKNGLFRRGCAGLLMLSIIPLSIISDKINGLHTVFGDISSIHRVLQHTMLLIVTGFSLYLIGIFLYEGIKPSYDNILQKLNAIINNTLQDIEKIETTQKESS